MPRRQIVKMQKIYEHRAFHWSDHYEKREMAKQMIEVGQVRPLTLIATISRELPRRELNVDASIVELSYPERVHAGSIEHAYRIRNDMAVTWYWDLACWQEFVRLFQSLPDPVEDYYWLYSVRTDVGRLMPMSSKPKQGSVPVDKSSKTVDKSVYKPVDKKPVSGTSWVKMPAEWRVPKDVPETR